MNNWIKKLLKSINVHFHFNNDTGSFTVNHYKFKIVQNHSLYDLKIIDLTNFSSNKKIENLFYDEIETSIKQTLEENI